MSSAVPPKPTPEEAEAVIERAFQHVLKASRRLFDQHPGGRVAGLSSVIAALWAETASQVAKDPMVTPGAAGALIALEVIANLAHELALTPLGPSSTSPKDMN